MELAEEYNLIVFNSTHHALAAEKVLKAADKKIMMVPILPEITADCGTAIKLNDTNKEALSLLEGAKIKWADYYHIIQDELERRIRRIKVD